MSENTEEAERTKRPYVRRTVDVPDDVRESIRDAIRGPVRADVRDDVREDVRERRRNRPSGTDELWVDVNKIPKGMDWNWKTEEIFGQHQQHDMLTHYENGWEPVMADRMPGYMPRGESGPIRRKGMILMERPMSLTKEAQEEGLIDAQAQVVGQERSLGIAPQGQGPRTRPNIQKNYGPIDIPE